MSAQRSPTARTLSLLLILAAAPAAAQQLPGDTLSFQSHGGLVRARFYRSSLPGPRPTVLLVHGFPGSPGDVLGLGEALSRGGWNALSYNPRGMHASEGLYSPEGGLEDASSALALLRDGAARFSVDTAQMALVGYSHGGWIALMKGIQGVPVRCIGVVAPDNLGLGAQRIIAGDTAYEAGLRQGLRAAAERGVVRGLGFENARAIMVQHRDDYDPTQHAASLRGKPVLVVGGWRDEGPTLERYVAPLVRALRSAGVRVTPVALDDDHTFRASRPELHRLVLEWLGKECLGSGQPAAGGQPTAGGQPR